jgi:predicted amidohydrolase YtcJ
MGSQMQVSWGPDRTRRVNPLAEWLAAGADLAAGSDLARPFNPMVGVWGMVTRGTKSAGVQGSEHAIDVATALRLYTAGTAALNGEADKLGTIAPGKLADLVAYARDPLTLDVDDLADLAPAFTVMDGKPTHDPNKRFAQ